MKFPKLSPEEQKRFKNGVIQVYGKAANRTVLGIIDAFLTLYPDVTYEELKKAIPDELNPTSHPSPRTIFKPYSDRPVGFVHSYEKIKKEFADAGLEESFNGVFFTAPDEIFTLKSGEKVVVVKMIDAKKDKESGISDLEALANHVKKYGIVVEEFSEAEAFKKGSYRLKIIDNQLFEKFTSREKIVEKKIIPMWVWFVSSAAVILLILWLIGLFSPKKDVEKIIQKDTIVQVRVDTVYIQQIQDIEDKFNAVQFEKGKAILPEDAKFALYDLSKLMKQNKNLKLRIEGHSSKEGDETFNQKLSEQRAKAVVDFLLLQGVDPSRLNYAGFGSSKPIDSINLEKNRRTEFVIEKD